MSTNTTNVKSLSGEITDGLQKGLMTEGTIVRITQGGATDFMNSEQIKNRQVFPTDPFVELEIAIAGKGEVTAENTKTVTGSLIKKNMKDYTRINGGTIPANSTLGQIMAICTIEEGGSIPLMTRAVKGRQDGKEFVVWEIAI